MHSPQNTSQSTAKHKTPTASKEDKPPSVKTGAGARGGAAGRNSAPQPSRGQGKITDFISPTRQVLASKNNKDLSDADSMDTSQDSVSEKPAGRRGRGRPKASQSPPPSSPAASTGSTGRGRGRKRRASSEVSSSHEEEEEEEEEEEDPPSPTPAKKARGRAAAKQ